MFQVARRCPSSGVWIQYFKKRRDGYYTLLLPEFTLDESDVVEVLEPEIKRQGRHRMFYKFDF